MTTTPIIDTTAGRYIAAHPALTIAIGSMRPDMLALAQRDAKTQTEADLYELIGSLIEDLYKTRRQRDKLVADLHEAHSLVQDVIADIQQIATGAGRVKRLVRQALLDLDNLDEDDC